VILQVYMKELSNCYATRTCPSLYNQWPTMTYPTTIYFVSKVIYPRRIVYEKLCAVSLHRFLRRHIRSFHDKILGFWKKNRSRDPDHSKRSGAPLIWNSYIWNAVCQFLCICEWIWISLATERSHNFYSNSVFRSLFVIGRCPMNMDFLSIEIEDLQIPPPPLHNKLAIFSKTAFTILIKSR
jgi:hypothetical protein